MPFSQYKEDQGELKHLNAKDLSGVEDSSWFQGKKNIRREEASDLEE